MSTDFPDSPYPFVSIVHSVGLLDYILCLYRDVKFYLDDQLLVCVKESTEHHLCACPPPIISCMFCYDMNGFTDGR